VPSEDEQQLRVMLARIEGKLDLLASQHRRQADDIEDHERRIRDVETSLHGLATKTDIEDIEKRRDAQLSERNRKTLAVASIFIALIVPIEAAIVAAVINSLGS
jgi:hypothetical protein